MWKTSKTALSAHTATRIESFNIQLRKASLSPPRTRGTIHDTMIEDESSSTVTVAACSSYSVSPRPPYPLESRRVCGGRGPPCRAPGL